MEQESGAAMFSADFKERAFPIYAAMREQGRLPASRCRPANRSGS